MEFRYPVQLEKAEEGGFVVTCRDLPEVVTQGEDLADAIDNAEGALQAAIEFRIEEKEEIPSPSKARRGEKLAAVPIATAMKAALYLATSGARGAATKIARALGVDEKEARRILDPRHRTKTGTLEKAVHAVGKRLVLVVE